MKKIVFSFLSIALLAGVSSCGKTTKGKMSNDWKVTSYEETATYVDADGDKNVNTISANESTITSTSVTTPSGGTSTTNTQTGTINEHTLTMKKDGTWIWIRNMSTSVGTSNNSIVTNNISETSGTWSFVGKSKDEDFKKNERILFNVLKSKNTSTETLNQTTQISSYSNTNTYLTGENVMIYTVTESKKKELTLEIEENSSNTQGSDVSTNSRTAKVTLKEK